MPIESLVVEYRPVAEFPGYRVGSDGSVWSCWRMASRGPGKCYRVMSDKWVRVSLLANNRRYGYVSARLCANSKRYFRRLNRLVLEITGVRVERLQAITEADVRAEGIEVMGWGDYPKDFSGIHLFEKRWDAINGKRHPWASSPWVWVIAFRKL